MRLCAELMNTGLREKKMMILNGQALNSPVLRREKKNIWVERSPRKATDLGFGIKDFDLCGKMKNFS